jgi:hypothetical protein
VPTVALVLLAAAFGAADQYLGSWPGHGWAADASLLAAPWLVLPFAVGCTQRSARRALTLAPLCTFVALLAYIAMTLSPVEEAKVSFVGVLGLLRWQVRWFLLGAITSPLFGWLGHRWCASRTLWAPIIPAAALILEPLARTVISQPIRSPLVRWLEIGAGAALCIVGLLSRLPSGASPISAPAHNHPRVGRCPDCRHDWAEHMPAEPCSQCRYEIEHENPDAPASACAQPAPAPDKA